MNEKLNQVNLSESLQVRYLKEEVERQKAENKELNKQLNRQRDTIATYEAIIDKLKRDRVGSY